MDSIEEHSSSNSEVDEPIKGKKSARYISKTISYDTISIYIHVESRF